MPSVLKHCHHRDRELLMDVMGFKAGFDGQEENGICAPFKGRGAANTPLTQYTVEKWKVVREEKQKNDSE